MTDAEARLVAKGLGPVQSLKDLNALKDAVLQAVDAARPSGRFSAEEVLPLAIIAAGDTTSLLAEKGDDLVRALKQVNLEGKAALALLFQMFVGTPTGAEKRYVLKCVFIEDFAFIYVSILCSSPIF
jgi:hypothetical protein